MTIQTALDQFPSLQGCVCAWEEELCDSMQALAAQCHRKPGALFSVVSEISIYRWNCVFVYQRRSDVLCERTLLCYRMSVMNNRLDLRSICWRIMIPCIFAAAQQKRNAATDWQSSSLIGYGNSFNYWIQTIEKDASQTHSLYVFVQYTMGLDPAWTKWQCVSVMQFATGTSHLFFRPAWQSSATMIAVSDKPSGSMAACRTTSRRCWSCVSVMLRIRAACTWKLLCTAAHVETRPGSARTQLTSVLRTVTAGTLLFLSSNRNYSGSVEEMTYWHKESCCEQRNYLSMEVHSLSLDS